MLKLIGLGIFDEKDISLRGIEEAKKSDEIYIETYTNVWHGSLNNLEKIMGKKINKLERSDVESEFLIKRAQEKDISLLVPGDPLSATTHFELIEEAVKNGIKYKIIHSSSIFTAIAETGLQLYKFGKTISVPKPLENYRPTSFYKEIEKNLKNGLHTLLLFDVEKFSFSDARKFLLNVDRELKGNIFKNEILVCYKFGSGIKNNIIYEKLENIKDEIEAPFVVIVPGNLHFKEKEALELWKAKEKH